MDFRWKDRSWKFYRNKMVHTTKDSVANMATIAGTGAMMIGWNEILTMVLIGTGILLNVIRIIEIRKRNQENS